MRREWIEISQPHIQKQPQWSPSMRREWIEMWQRQTSAAVWLHVSLHAEGVD